MPGPANLHALAPSADAIDWTIAGICIASGVVSGLVAVWLSAMVRVSESLFARLRVHWMWWPAIGGAAVGFGGLFAPHAMGVGYEVITANLTGSLESVEPGAGAGLLLAILVVKAVIWPIALGSGTSGGILAPAFVIGSSLGALEASVLPDAGPGLWALVALAGTLSGLLRAPVTAVIFAAEITSRWDALVPLTLAALAACAVSMSLMKRSLLSDKVVRGGLHLSRDYGVDPLSVVLASDVMDRDPVRLPATMTLAEACAALWCTGECCTELCDTCETSRPRAEADRTGGPGSGGGASAGADETSIHPHCIAERQALFPVITADDRVTGFVTHAQLNQQWRAAQCLERAVGTICIPSAVTAAPDDTLTEVAEAMAVYRVEAMPVVETARAGRDAEPAEVAGIITLRHLLAPRAVRHTESTTRERLIGPARRPRAAGRSTGDGI